MLLLRLLVLASPPVQSMALSLLLCSLLLLGHAGAKAATATSSVPVEFLYPPFNLTYIHFIDTNGVFLLSRNATFSAAVYNGRAVAASPDQQSRFFFSVLHAASRTPVWTASTSLQSMSILLSLTVSGGLALSDPAAPAPAWSTPSLAAPVAALRLLDTGELALTDAANATLWSSFARPTDTLLQGQTLRVGVPLAATASEQDLSPGAYRLLLTPSDALLQWASSPNSSFLTYWALSSDPASVQDSKRAVQSMAVNASGIYLLAANGKDTVFRLLFPSAPEKGESRLVKVDPSGRLRALSMTYSPTAARATLPTVWAAPADDCDLPLPCGSVGLCAPGSNGSSCMCPDGFSAYTIGGCSPADGSALPILPESCVAGDASSSAPSYNYMSLGDGIGYFANKFARPASAGDALPACRDLCSANCSCLGFIYNDSSKSCFLMQNQIGSVFRARTDVAVGFIKGLPPPSHDPGGSGSGSSLSSITIIFGIVLPAVAAVFITFLLYVMGVQWLRRRQLKNGGGGKKCVKHNGSEGWHRILFKLHMLSPQTSSNIPSASEDADSDQDEVLIPGLPARFKYADLDAATNGFLYQIGTGGFGSVFRGELPDRTTVAVKRMNNLGMQGRREFLTEIAVIGNVHHVNLVKLRGFCAEGARQLLVYEYMNRGSLGQCLFRAGAATLEWPDRLRVCVGAARGLAYLHAGCDRKILHCDVKPENILLDDHGGVKIADFGLAKLVSPEQQSGLFTTMRGTRGYLAPEWLMDAPITDKADVYSFGMVLLEIVRGRKNSKNDSSSSGEGSAITSSDGCGERGSYFPALALDLHEEERYKELADQRLEGRVDVAEVARVVRVALCCLHEDAALRPAMTAVSGMLDGSMDVDAPRTEHLRYLRTKGRGLVDVRPGGWTNSDEGKG